MKIRGRAVPPKAIYQHSHSYTRNRTYFFAKLQHGTGRMEEKIYVQLCAKYCATYQNVSKLYVMEPNTKIYRTVLQFFKSLGCIKTFINLLNYALKTICDYSL